LRSDIDHGGMVFREAWITGVTTHFPGTPKDSYITAWENMPDWERASAAAVYRQVVAFIAATDGAATRLAPELKGQFVAICWIGQIYAHIPDPKPGMSRRGTSCPNGSRRPTSASSRRSSEK
jgi:hypothetical protein